MPDAGNPLHEANSGACNWQRLCGPFNPCWAHGSTLVKCGRVRSEKPKGMRLPSTFCCPTHAIICEMLMNEPCTSNTGYGHYRSTCTRQHRQTARSDRAEPNSSKMPVRNHVSVALLHVTPRQLTHLLTCS